VGQSLLDLLVLQHLRQQDSKLQQPSRQRQFRTGTTRGRDVLASFLAART
jgi:hypothetical protein